MATAAPTAATWTWPPDVNALAAEVGVTAYLQPIYEMTRRVYRNAPLTVEIEYDPEIPDERHILFQADVTGWDVPQLVAADNEWCSQIFEYCPSTHVHVFRVGLVASE